MFNQNSSLVINTLEIYNLLKNIQKSKQLISLSFESLPQHCLTSLLDVQHDGKILLFDEPNPSLSSKLLKSKSEAEFSLKLGKLPVIFKTNLISNDQASNIYAPFPKEIYYPQNRDYYRFRTEFVDGINATVYMSSTKQLKCKLINISLNGLCLRFPYSFAPTFQIDNLIDDIYIKLPQQNGFSVSAKIQNTRIENNYANIDLGLKILYQKPNIEKTIQQFIFRSENI